MVRNVRTWLIGAGAILLGACAPGSKEGPQSQGTGNAPLAPATIAATITAKAATAAMAPARTPAGTTPRKFDRPPPPKPVAGELLIRFRAGTPASKLTNTVHKMSVSAVRGFASVPRLRKVTLAPGVSMAAAMEAYRTDPDVEYVEPNYRWRKAATPNDPRFVDQWALKNTGQARGRAGVDIGAEAAWDIDTGGAGVVIAVIDTGVDYNHEDLAENIYRNETECTPNGIDDDGNGYIDDCRGIDTAEDDVDPMDTDGHGTHVSGIIAAVGNNGIGITGIAWHSKILPCRFIGASGEGDTADIITCLDYVAALKDRGVNIVATNNSYGGGDDSRALRDAIEAQLARGILFIAAAGNDAQRADDSHYYPSGEALPCAYRVPNIICVGASDRTSGMAYFSNRGSNSVHISAPGSEILSTWPGNQYAQEDGTSMAAPHVAGVAALLRSAVPSRDWRAIRNLILASGSPVQGDLVDRGLNHETVTGTILNAAQAMACGPSPINRRLFPRTTGPHYYQAPLNGPQPIEVLSIACADSYSATQTVVVNPGGVNVTLHDDGTGLDRVAGDGVFSGSWRPTALGDYTLVFPGKLSYANGIADDNIFAHVIGTKPGFPQRMLRFAQGGSAAPMTGHPVLITNLDDTPDQEVMSSGTPIGPSYAWKSDGTPIPGWPVWVTEGIHDVEGGAMLAAGNLSGDPDTTEIMAGYSGLPGPLEALARDGTMLPGWPRDSANYVVVAPVLVDFDGDGLDEILTSESDFSIRGYHGDGTPLPGFPAYLISDHQGQTPFAPMVADLNNDGRPEFASTSENSAGGVLAAWRTDAKMVRGFPVETPEELQPVGAGDVDGDGSQELVFLTIDAGWTSFVNIFGGDGTLKRSWSIPNTNLGGRHSGVLADMNQDGIPEIIVASRDPNHPPQRIAVYDGQGNLLPGWPANINVGGGPFLVGVGMAVGDLDGDRKADIFLVAGSEMYVIRNDGTVAPGFPLANGDVLTDTIYPAIADIDGDGRNEVILRTDAWQGDWGFFRQVYVYDFGMGTNHGPVEWAMMNGDQRRTSNYKTGKNLVSEAYLAVQAQGPGTVSSPAGIDCGPNCLRRFAKGTRVTLTAAPGTGETFRGWSGACTGTNLTCTVTINDYTAVAASFRSQNLSATVAGNGTITSAPAGLNCSASCTQPFGLDSFVTLTASAAADSEFTGWSGDCSGMGACSLTLDVAKSVTANFRLKPRIAVTRLGTGNSTFTSTPAGIDCGATCTAPFATDSAVQINATVASNSEYVGWQGACTTVSATACTLVADVDKGVTLETRLKPELTITRSGNGGGTITSVPAGISCGADCSEFFATNGTVTLTLTPAGNSIFGGWTGACSGTLPTCTLTMDAAKTAGVTLTAKSKGGGKGGGGSLDLAALALLAVYLLRRQRRHVLQAVSATTRPSN